ncbi:MAG: hypothetical protein J0H80_03610, partial [Rhizobiales bacterium]|nr:hypothetical protein [Hyphomicrobiales bacterium]
MEVIRGIGFLLRTPGWGTPSPVIGNLQVDEDARSFHIGYEACFGGAGNGVLAKIDFTAHAEGHIEATADIRADVPFSTNRTGFVILHPLLGFAGREAEVEHASGQHERLTIPLHISPGQPVFDIRAIAPDLVGDN